MEARHLLSLDILSRLDDDQATQLEIPSKVPMYDGFNINFIKNLWYVIGEKFS